MRRRKNFRNLIATTSVSTNCNILELKSSLGCGTYKNRWRELMNRSALVLKLLTSGEHRSIVAAPTFGLPQNIGGMRNWDYRYSWIRDSSSTLYG